ncbi:hypothetical protein KVH27_27915 [Streptomyces olivaceus]|uniref:hypothetical protein n=1 Tax=Streptomyces olivaceus TaxID=47716 RepID=UPI001CCFECDC|nr:hypothetical protein [Streptomyces olivaceus]MBZ6252178.1 hypothetical protein [Streptomyces olivaceus]
MTTLASRWYVTRDGGGRVETANHPETGERRWACSACSETGTGEETGRAHAATCTTTTTSGGGILPLDQFR